MTISDLSFSQGNGPEGSCLASFMRSPEPAIRLHLQTCVHFWQISGDRLSLIETLSSFFLPMSESGLWIGDACSLSPYFFKKVIFRSIGQLARLLFPLVCLAKFPCGLGTFVFLFTSDHAGRGPI